MDEDVFVKQFSDCPGRRKELVDGLVDAGRLTLNIPRSGLARRIAERLRQGAFSDYYEFEKLLARALHPVLANLNLNAVADILVNRLFSERYSAYVRDFNVVLAAGGTPGPRALKNVITRMVKAEGHYMAIKFYDLVLRGIDPVLAKSLKTVETSLMQMKKGFGADIEKNRSVARQIMGGVHGSHGDDVAALLLVRMEWDDDLRDYVTRLAGESGLAGYDEVSNEKDRPSEMDRESVVIETHDGDNVFGDEPVEEDNDAQPIGRRFSEDAIVRYARMIKTDYLDPIDPDEEGKIRGIIKGIYVKNEKVYNGEKAAETVRQVLALWLSDSSLDDRVRRLLENIAREEGDAAQVAISPGEQMVLADDVHEGQEDDRIGNDGSGPMDGSEGTGAFLDDMDDMVVEHTDMDHSEISDASPAADKALPGESITGGVMEDLISDISGKIETEAPAAGHGVDKAESENAIVSGDELDALLDGFSEEIPAGSASEEGGEDHADFSANEYPDYEENTLSLEQGTEGHLELSDSTYKAQEELHDEGNSGGQMGDLPGDDATGSVADVTASEPMEKNALLENPTVSGDELDALLDGIDNDAVVEEAFLIDEGDSPVVEKSAELSLSGAGDDNEYLLDEKKTGAPEETDDEQVAVAHEDFIVKDELLFEDKSFKRKAAIRERKKASKIHVTMRDIADTGERKNLLALMDLLSEMDAAADVSHYIVGSGVNSAVRNGISRLLECDGLNESLEFIRNAEMFDHKEKIIILQKWLRPVALSKGWIDGPHDDRLELIRKTVEFLAASMVKAESAGARDSGGPDQEEIGYSIDIHDEERNASKPVDIQQKEMIKTGDESIRLSHDIEEFRDLYESGIDDASVAERVPEMRSFFEKLAAGEDGAVHFAVYHKPAFLSFLEFIDAHPDLKEQLDIDAALEYCTMKRIL